MVKRKVLESVGELKPAVLHLQAARHFHLWGARNPDFFRHRLQTSMTRATVEDSTAGLGVLWLVCYPSRTSPGICVDPLAHRLPGGIQAQGVRTRVSCSGVGQLPATARPGWRSVQRRRADQKHVNTMKHFGESCFWGSVATRGEACQTPFCGFLMPRQATARQFDHGLRGPQPCGWRGVLNKYTLGDRMNGSKLAGASYAAPNQ